MEKQAEMSVIKNIKFLCFGRARVLRPTWRMSDALKVNHTPRGLVATNSCQQQSQIICNERK